MNEEKKVLPAFNFMVLMPEDIYSQHLKTVGSVSFTRREIDIIACLLSGRAAKTIASFLRISPRTVETHMRNIMFKIRGSSRESIIDFIEKAGKFSITRKHYQNLLIEAAFEKRLREVAFLTKAEKHDCILAYEQDDQLLFISYIAKHLTVAGIQARISKATAQRLSINSNFKTVKSIIYVIPENLNEGCLESFSLHSSLQALFLLPTLEDAPLLDKGVYILLTEQENCYFLILEILRRLLPHTSLKQIISEFKVEHGTLQNSSSNHASHLPELAEINTKNKIITKPNKWKIWFSLSGFSCVSAVLLYLLLEKAAQISPNKNINEHILTSDLAIPAKNAFLPRPAIVKQLEDSLKENQDIKAVALVGIGGAGKTTLARQYARAQSSSLVWEINSETKESLLHSFESLAYSLAATENEQEILRGIQEVRNAEEREEKLLVFVKRKLKTQNSWLLIFDNIEGFTHIQKYFPYDSKAWGKGKVIVTTRDLNIKDNNYISHTIVVGELSAAEKLSLLMRILGKGTGFSNLQSKQAESFLVHIPPYPLDVSIAAHYLKAAHISYEDYLHRLNKYDEQSLKIQEKFLKDANGYTKTRYSIISASLQKLIDENKEFAELLLFISFLDSKDIPRKLLNTYKNDIIVDSFIYSLKKHSLVIRDNLNSSYSTSSFSLHDSTQEISRAYLTRVLNIRKNAQILESLADILGNYIAERIKQDDIPSLRNLVNHCDTFLKHSSPWHNFINVESLKGELGGIYYHLGYFVRAKDILKQVYIKAHDSKTYNKIPRVLVYLGSVYKLLGSFKKAKALLEQSLNIYTRHSPKSYSEIAWISAFLGDVYNELGCYTKANSLLQQSLLDYKKYDPKNFAAIAWVSGYLGTTHTKLGNYKEAKLLLEHSLEIYRKHCPQNHIRIAWVSKLLGRLNIEMGNYKNAKALLEQSLSIYKKYEVLDNWPLKLLGDLYQRLGNVEEAKALLERCLTSFEAHYGKNHPSTARVLASLGDVYLQEGCLETSESSLKRALQIFEQNCHPESYIPLESLGDLYLQRSTQALKEENNQQAQEFKAQAIEYFNYSFEVIKANFPADSPHIARVYSKLKS